MVVVFPHTNRPLTKTQPGKTMAYWWSDFTKGTSKKKPMHGELKGSSWKRGPCSSQQVGTFLLFFDALDPLKCQWPVWLSKRAHSHWLHSPDLLTESFPVSGRCLFGWHFTKYTLRNVLIDCECTGPQQTNYRSCPRGQKLTLGWCQDSLLRGELPKQHPDADNKSSDCSRASLYALCYGVWSAGGEVQTGRANQANPHGTEQEGSFELGKRLKLHYYFISLISLVVHDNHSSIPISSYLTNTEWLWGVPLHLGGNGGEFRVN